MNGGSSVLAAPHCLFLFADKGIEKILYDLDILSYNNILNEGVKIQMRPQASTAAQGLFQISYF